LQNIQLWLNWTKNLPLKGAAREVPRRWTISLSPAGAMVTRGIKLAHETLLREEDSAF
jgi:hypothetical protein